MHMSPHDSLQTPYRSKYIHPQGNFLIRFISREDSIIQPINITCQIVLAILKKMLHLFFLVKVNPHRRYRIYLYMYIPVSMGITETSSFITLAPIFTNIDLCLFDTVSITCIPQYLFSKNNILDPKKIESSFIRTV